ncbi:hypothetical protein GWK47_021746 [Chionoecetes opilio]|uniref:Uncharacterized protein n=1 Tax=Chionoecetes opilio TaxID=41210 RepID=A0A8J4XP18_CHIOP|nr:hypothetical protein GWK47_021746 [Chionoecetes opilio]
MDGKLRQSFKILERLSSHFEVDILSEQCRSCADGYDLLQPARVLQRDDREEEHSDDGKATPTTKATTCWRWCVTVKPVGQRHFPALSLSLVNR